MLQPVLLINENQKQGLVIVIEKKAIIHDFKIRKTTPLTETPFHTASGSLASFGC